MLAAASDKSERWCLLFAKYEPNRYGCSVAEQVTLIDLCNQYASGQWDNSEATPAKFVPVG